MVLQHKNARIYLYGCTGLTKIPPLTHIISFGMESCKNMFEGCTGLTEINEFHPDYPIDTFTSCFENMFKDCINIKKVIINKIGLGEVDDFKNMFNNCSKLSYIKIGFPYWARNTENWVEGVAEHGTFVCPKELPIEYGVSRIPEGWTVETY